MCMERLWNDTYNGTLKSWERNVIYRGWWVNEWVWGIFGEILTGET